MFIYGGIGAAHDGVDGEDLQMVRTLTRWLVPTAVAVLTLAIAPVTGTPQASAAPHQPTTGFFAAPAGVADLKPGTVIRSRRVAVKSLQALPLNADSWQLLYRTTDMQGAPDVTTTTVIVPRGERPSKLLSYQAATDAVDSTCAPSHQLTKGAPIDLTTPKGPVTLNNPAAEMLLASAGLAKGWAVAIPDHGGSRNTFLTPHQPGYAVLDGIRAAQSFAKTGLSASSPTALWGYSGGAIASSWAVEEQPTYAPELNIVGAAFGAPERDLAASLKSVNFTPLAGLIPIALGALGKDSSEFKTALNKYLTPAGKAKIKRTLSRCVVENIVENLWFDYRNFLTKPVNVVLQDPVIKKTIAARGVTGRGSKVPLYIYNGITEEVAPITGTDKLVRSYCRAGSRVTYRREQLPPNPIPQISSTHGIELILGGPAALSWLDRRMAAVPVATGCDIKTTPSTFATAGALRELGPSFIVNPLATMLGLPIGK